MALDFCDQSDLDMDIQSTSWTYEMMVANLTHPVKFSYTFRQLCDADLKQVIHEVFIINQCTELDLSGNQITDLGAAMLAQALQNNKTLIKLSLAWNQIDDTGAKYLAEVLRHNTTLNELDLWGNEISEIGVYCFVETLRYNTMLRRLELGGSVIPSKLEKQLQEQDYRIKFSSIYH